jgi:invasion protein IalB
LLAALSLVSFASAQEASPSLPGGASSLQETYQDWGLACQSDPRVCLITQQQAQQNGQRVLAIELRQEGESSVSGNLILPFGLSLDAGAILQVDDGAPAAARPFSTCVPAGCIVPLTFDAETVAALRAGETLRLKLQNVDRKEVTLSISLKGFGAALDRLNALSPA